MITDIILMKNLFLTALSFFSFVFSFLPTYAQHETSSAYIADRYWSINLSGGIVLMRHASTSPLLSTRPNLGAQQHFRVQHAFSKKWLWYAGYGANYYSTERPAILDPSHIGIHKEDVVEGIFGAFEALKLTLDGGIQYRIQAGRWEILPQLGLGYTVNDWGRDREIDLKEEGTTLHYQMKGALLNMQAGLNGHFWLFRKGYLFMGITAEHPLQKAWGEAIYTKGEEEISRNKVRSARFGQNLNVELGYAFVFGRR